MLLTVAQFDGFRLPDIQHMAPNSFMAMSPSDHRTRFDTTLRHIETDMVRMGHLVIEMIELATRIALEDDPSLLEQVAERETRTDWMEDDILERVMVTLALESPVAKDLMLLAATIVMIGEMEKVGDEAMKLASRICKLQGEFPFDLRELLVEMSGHAQANLREALRLYTQFNAEVADGLIASDDTMDRAYKVSRNAILEKIKDDATNARQLFRVAEIFHALEHVSDHTVDMAKRLKGVYERFTRSSLAE